MFVPFGNIVQFACSYLILVNWARFYFFLAPWSSPRLDKPQGFSLLAISHNFLMLSFCQEDRGGSSKRKWLVCVWDFGKVLVTYKGYARLAQGQLHVIFHHTGKKKSPLKLLQNSQFLNFCGDNWADIWSQSTGSPQTSGPSKAMHAAVS